MSHYANLAAVAFRVIAVSLLGYGVATFALAASLALAVGAPAVLLSAGYLLLPGVCLYFAAPLLGRIAVHGIGDP